MTALPPDEVPTPTESTEARVPETAEARPTCRSCDGEGRTDSNPDISERAPWSFWTNLPPGSDLAVRLGLVRPMKCANCNGTGEL